MAKESEEEKAQKRVNELHEKHVEAGYQWLDAKVVYLFPRAHGMNFIKNYCWESQENE